MTKLLEKFSRLFSLLFLLYFLTSCDSSTRKVENKVLDSKDLNLVTDSLIITIDKISPNTLTGFNVVSNSLELRFLEFLNSTNEYKSIEKELSIGEECHIMSFIGSSLINGKAKNYRHYYLIDETISNLNFEYFEGNVSLKYSQDLVIDDIIKDYQTIYNSYKSKSGSIQNFYKELDAKYSFYNKKFLLSNKSDNFNLLNEFLYIDNIQNANHLDKRVDSYVKNLKQPIYSNMLGNFIYFYVKNRFNDIDFTSLNTDSYTDVSIDLQSKGLYMYLKQIKNDNNVNFKKAYSWLKKTSFYKANYSVIDKELDQFNHQEFSNILRNLPLIDSSGKKVSYSEGVKHLSSKYYIIDFWATWCGPCIYEYEILNKLSLPSNVEVISLSLDKYKDADKWKKQSVRLNQKTTFLIDDSAVSRKFTKLLEISSIPRYLIVDKDYNLIESNFSKPSDEDFLERLKASTRRK